MASTKMRALVGIGRLLLGIGIGIAVGWMWMQERPMDEWYLPWGAGLLCAVVASVLLDRMKGGGD